MWVTFISTLVRLRESSREASFAIDAVKNVILFIVVALSAAGLHKVVEWLEHNFGLPLFVTKGLYLVAYAIFLVDIVGILVFLVRESWDRLGELDAPRTVKCLIAIGFLVIGAIASPYAKRWYVQALLFLIGAT